MATALALQTLPTLAVGALADSNKNGVPDTVETFLGRNPAAIDRSEATGNGLAVAGSTVSNAVAGGNQNQSFSYALANAGGTAPYTWRIASGYLPDGLSLNATTGLISGTPTTGGTFNFRYTVTDATGTSSTIASQISISDNSSDDDVPTLPEWAAILMALMLMGSITLKSRQQWT